MKNIPNFVRNIFSLVFSCLIFFALARLVMLCVVGEELHNLTFIEIIQALYIGFKFDGRLAVLVTIPFWVIFFIPQISLKFVRPFLLFYACLAFSVMMLLYGSDIGYYMYLQQRLDATFIDLARDINVAMTMVWQSYPVVWLSLAGIIIIGLFGYLFNIWFKKVIDKGADKLGWKKRFAWSFASLLLLTIMIFGQISSNFFPLRWSNAYFNPNRVSVILALNPVQNLYDTYVLTLVNQPDVNLAKQAYPYMSEWLDVKDKDINSLNYWRKHEAKESIGEKPNVVIILMESLGTPRTSLADSLFDKKSIADEVHDDPTPHLRRIAQDSMYYRWFFAPARTTARAIFTTISGIPDINRAGGTSSRNPSLVDQFTVFNEFDGYEKSYMLGGSANWANIRGILTYNVEGLTLLEETDWKAPNVDVWGISDLDLFKESIPYFNAKKEPFIGVIQTAGFHRPWTIPDDNDGFEIIEPSPETITKYGFENADEFNSMRFSDHALNEFLKRASKEKWYDNTIFVIFGDHGLDKHSTNMPGGYLACGLQSSHVPLLIYAPGREDLIKKGVSDRPSGHVDVFPTLAKLVGLEFYDRNMGRDLLDPKYDEDAQQFIASYLEQFFKLVDNEYCYKYEGQDFLFEIEGDNVDVSKKYPERVAKMHKHAFDFNNTAKYMLFNNKKANAPNAK